MNHPAGLAIDANGRLWVTEDDYLPKRVSIWNGDGTLWKAFYGPAKYGGGGTLDPQDQTRFYYADEGRGAMEFKLDWEKGESLLTRVFYRRGAGACRSRSTPPRPSWRSIARVVATSRTATTPIRPAAAGWFCSWTATASRVRWQLSARRRNGRCCRRQRSLREFLRVRMGRTSRRCFSGPMQTTTGRWSRRK